MARSPVLWAILHNIHVSKTCALPYPDILRFLRSGFLPQYLTPLSLSPFPASQTSPYSHFEAPVGSNLLRVLWRGVQSHCLPQEQVATCQDLTSSEIVCKGTRSQEQWTWKQNKAAYSKTYLSPAWTTVLVRVSRNPLLSNLTHQYLYCIYYLVIEEWQEGDWGLGKSMRRRGRNETYCWAKVKRAAQALQTADLLVLPPSLTNSVVARTWLHSLFGAGGWGTL